MPMSMVMRQPPGSLPGMSALAMAPAIRPIRIQAMMLMVWSVPTSMCPHPDGRGAGGELFRVAEGLARKSAQAGNRYAMRIGHWRCAGLRIPGVRAAGNRVSGAPGPSGFDLRCARNAVYRDRRPSVDGDRRREKRCLM
ncbi:hypothetical protein GCM10010326_06770 [Streptomyces xanthochromogenes]|uniref:Uncharacterized protein n=1 Tax=Streptomyces xanthochromogenes TaxID=67384 RepID=A0ABQ2ZLY0_9ACTN|nr:hypothetical protein GCM10010326_06770 [Streptomyces xanthochromogenes]